MHSLSKKQKKVLYSINWFHQRFDGCPNFIISNPISAVTVLREVFGDGFINHINLIEKDKDDWFGTFEDQIRISNKVLKKLEKEGPDFYRELYNEWKTRVKKYYDLCYYIERINTKKLGNKKLLNLYESFAKSYIYHFGVAMILDTYPLQSDKVIYERLLRELPEKKKKFLSTYFIKLTAPIKESFLNVADNELKKIAKTILRNPKLEKAFSKNKIKPELMKKIKAYQKKFFWIHNNYATAKIIGIKDIVNELKILVKKKEEILSWKPKDYNKIKSEKKKLFKKLGLSKFFRDLIEITEISTYWQDERKETTFWSTHIRTKLLTEIAKRYGYTFNQLKYTIPEEIVGIKYGKMPDKKELDLRIKGIALIGINRKLHIFVGKDYKSIDKKKLFPAVSGKLKQITGIGASPGKATGRVCVLKSATEVSKMKKGQILVAVMTRPDYVIAMKKAAAIVTDEGGITCHAAIVSRELGIPCIIGTKIATHVLKDNDFVSVDAEKGLVIKK